MVEADRLNESTLLKLKEEVILAAARAYTRGIQTGSGGNFSARIPGTDCMLVKASGGSFMDVTPDNMLITDFDGNVVSGEGKPTREALLHGFIYKVAPAVNGVMHCHAPWSISWAMTKKPLENVTLHTALKFACPIEILDVKEPVVGAKDFPRIEALFQGNPNLPAFILVDHGIVAVGNNIINAEHNAELVEETAMIAYLKTVLGKTGL